MTEREFLAKAGFAVPTCEQDATDAETRLGWLIFRRLCDPNLEPEPAAEQIAEALFRSVADSPWDPVIRAAGLRCRPDLPFNRGQSPLLLAVIGKALQRVSDPRLRAARASWLKSRGQFRFSEAHSCYRRAVDELASCGPESALRRHFAWLAADLALETDDRQSAARHLNIALQGPSLRATPGLYLNCASRSFRLEEERQEALLGEVGQDLYEAWLLPGCCPPDAARGEGSPCGQAARSTKSR